jgi:polysaccharide export outer membrane protein
LFALFIQFSDKSHDRLDMKLQIIRKTEINSAVCFFALLLMIHASVCSGGDLSSYRLGPDDQVSIRVIDMDKLQLDNASAPKINVNGDLDLPVIGHLHAEGLTLDQLKAAIASRLSDILNHPSVSVSIVQYRNHPISVLGSVRNPGVFQVAQSKRLLEVISMAGGLAPDSGDKIRISRAKSSGMLPLPNVSEADSNGYYVGTINIKSLIDDADTRLNIPVLDGDVIAVSKAELVYVMGAVKHAGGFPLGNKTAVSILQALSMAEGFDRAASPNKARLLREEKAGQDRTETVVDLKPIMAGTAPDITLRANDILYVPTSGAKLASMRAIEAAVQVGTGFAVFH